MKSGLLIALYTLGLSLLVIHAADPPTTKGGRTSVRGPLGGGGGNNPFVGTGAPGPGEPGYNPEGGSGGSGQPVFVPGYGRANTRTGTQGPATVEPGKVGGEGVGGGEGFGGELASSALAQGGWYVAVQAGGALLSDAELDDPTGALAPLGTKFDFYDSGGYTITGSIGYAFSNNFRTEAEVNYATNDIDTGVGFLGFGSIIGGDVNSHGYMANLFYEYDLGYSWMPYIGGGVGIAKISVNGVKSAGALFAPGVRLADDEDKVLAYQIGAGISFKYSPSITYTLDYRYFTTEDLDFTAVTGAPFSFDYERNDFRVGVRFSF